MKSIIETIAGEKYHFDLHRIPLVLGLNQIIQVVCFSRLEVVIVNTWWELPLLDPKPGDLSLSKLKIRSHGFERLNLCL